MCTISKSPLISIIVPVYNAELYLNRCIESIIVQTHSHFELLLIDDGSTDRSGMQCNEWMEKDSRIQVFHQKNQGQSSARNIGIDNAKGEYLTFIDADDFVSDDYLSYLLLLINSYNSCDISACNHYIVRKKQTANARESEGDVKVFTRAEAYKDVLYHGCIDVSPWGKLYKRSIWEDLRFPEDRIFEDTWLFGEILNRIQSIVYGFHCCYDYNIHEGSTVQRRFNDRSTQYIEAAEKLASHAVECDPNLYKAAIRRINHARLSVLRSMEQSDKELHPLRCHLRDEIIESSSIYIREPDTPSRDIIAIRLLKLGLNPFFLGWKIYSMLREGVF